MVENVHYGKQEGNYRAILCTGMALKNYVCLLVRVPKDFFCHRHDPVRLEAEFLLELLERS